MKNLTNEKIEALKERGRVYHFVIFEEKLKGEKKKLSVETVPSEKIIDDKAMQAKLLKRFALREEVNILQMVVTNSIKHIKMCYSAFGEMETLSKSRWN